jgi:bacterioferritin
VSRAAKISRICFAVAGVSPFCSSFRTLSEVEGEESAFCHHPSFTNAKYSFCISNQRPRTAQITGEDMSAQKATAPPAALTREKLIDLLNEDLSREYQAIISYVNYSQVLKGAQYMNIANELAIHATEELAHAIALANHIDYLGGMPTATPKLVKTSEKNEEMLRFDLENEKETIANYRRRIKQCDELNEYAIGESIREILMQEQDHLIALATALGIDPPNPGIAD